MAQITDVLFSVCKEAVEKANIDSDDILAVNLSSQGAAMVLLDENGNVVRNRMIGWQDLRNIEVHAKIYMNIMPSKVPALVALIPASLYGFRRMSPKPGRRLSG